MTAANEKNQMRAECRARRGAIPVALRAAHSAAIHQHLRAFLGPPKGKRLLATLEIGSEWESLPFARYWLQADGVLVLPRVASDRKLELRAVTDLAHDVERGVWGIREPKPDAGLRVEPATLDMIVVPGLAFDDAGYRLGYGGGYFDALIESAPQAQAIGAGFALQRVPRVPREPWDRSVRAYASEAGVEHFER